MSEQVEPYTVKLTFYKGTGKYYTEGTATTTHYPFDPAFKQDIVNTQNALSEGWQDEFFVTTDNVRDEDPFACSLYPVGTFADFKKEKNT